ncbi:hypothetical protein BDW62DRAFT_220223 [Aspergillus aurantiobrunneus]
MSVNVAIIGGGIWAREQHLPAVEAAKELNLKAVFSRSFASAQSVADRASCPVDLYSNDSDKGYTDLLRRPDIDAVIISLPIPNQAQYIREALKAGKHVLSEKPVCANVQEAEDLIKWYRSEIKDATWAVAENFRFLNSFIDAAEQLKSLGRIIGFQGREHMFIEPDFPFHLTEWRRNPTHQGGYVLDFGVHFMASLRMLLAVQPGNEVARVSAFTNLIQPHLRPVDTADAILRTRSGVTGTFQIHRGTTLRAGELTVACEKGSVTVEWDKVTIRRDGQEEVRKVANEGYGVAPVVRAWGESIFGGKLSWGQGPEAALGDLELIELMLRSGEADGIPLDCTRQNAQE